MITDAFLSLSSAQTITTTAVSTNSIDLGVARDIGPGEELEIAITIDTTFSGGTSVNFQFITSAAGGLGSPTVHVETGAVVTAQLTAGRAPIVIRVPRTLLTSQPIGQRYIGLQYTVVGTYSAGAVTANLMLDASDVNKLYPTSITIL